MYVVHDSPGVHSVDAKYEKNEVTVKGTIEVKKVHEKLQKWSKKKVEIISETKSKVAKETKKVKHACICDLRKNFHTANYTLIFSKAS